MKLACTSAAFSQALDRGDLTQLEFLDHAAGELGADGVVLDERHFPRTDVDYLAQVKKMAADRATSIVAVNSDRFFGAADDEIVRLLAIANALGAPLMGGRLATETTMAWSAQLDRLGVATGEAKRANVTLAVRNGPGTFAASTHDCKRVSKESDSAWLRFGLDPAAFDAASDPTALAERTVLLWAPADADAAAFLEAWPSFNGFAVLDDTAGTATVPEMQRAIRRWRIARAQFELNRI